MSSTSARSPDEPYDDPLGLDEPLMDELERSDAPIEPLVATGLSDEDDAARNLALRFDPSAGFCRNCEGYYRCDVVDGVTMTTFCPRCAGFTLYVPGTPPLRARQKV